MLVNRAMLRLPGILCNWLSLIPLQEALIFEALVQIALHVPLLLLLLMLRETLFRGFKLLHERAVLTILDNYEANLTLCC